MRRTRVRFAVVLVGTGIGLAYLLSAVFLVYLLLALQSAYGLVPTALMIVPSLVLSIVAAVAVSIPLQFLGAFLVSHGIRNEAASPFWETSSESIQPS
jgi:hypothetical protein